MTTKPAEDMTSYLTLTDKQLLSAAIKRYPVENPNCETERAFKRLMRQEWIDKIKKLKDGSTASK